MGSPYRDAERGGDYAPYSMGAHQDYAVWGISFPNHDNKIEVYESHDGNGESLRDLILQFLQTYDPTAQAQSSNATPKWSPTPPTKDGWYWVREVGFTGRFIARVKDGEAHAESFGTFSTDYAGLQWAGPLQEPTE